MSMENQVNTKSRTSEILNEDEASCGLCSGNDTIDMVSCDGCHQWFHFKCVGVDATVVSKDWICQNCISRFRSLSRSNMDREKELSTQLEDVKRLRTQLQNDVFQQEIAELKTLVEIMSRNMVIQPRSDTAKKSEHPTSNGDPNSVANLDDAAKYEPTNDGSNHSTPRFEGAETRRKYTTISDGENQVEHFLARQTITRDLPSFSGSPEEWPTFLATFEYSTNACKYSDVENLCRLQKALKGDARRVVEAYLTHPSNVLSIIDTLKMLYGRPALIIQTQIDKIKRSPAPKAEKLETLIFYAVQVRNLLAAIESAKIKEYLNDIRLLHELVERLPPQIRLNWGLYETHELAQSEPKLKQFSRWLDTIAKSACNVTTRVLQMPKLYENSRVNIHSSRDDDVDDERSYEKVEVTKCRICEKSCQNATKCKKFADMTLNSRWNVVNRLKLCRMCLMHHKYPRCNKAKECGINNCQKLHHQLLHNDDKRISTSTTRLCDTIVATAHRAQPNILYRIVPVTLKYRNKLIDTFAFIDDGSSLTLVQERIANQLHMKGTEKQLCMRWTNGQSHLEPKSRTATLQIAPREDQTIFHEIHVQTVSNLDLPTQSINRDAMLKKYKHLKNVEFQSFETAVPTILIGLDNWHLCVPTKVKEGSRYEPVASKTRLGWDLCGALSSSTECKKHRINVHACDCSDGRLEEVVKKFYALDSLGISNKKEFCLTEEENRAEKIMHDMTVYKAKNYEVPLLWKYDRFQLPDSYGMAYQRLLCLERKLLGNSQLLTEFRRQINQYVEKGFIRKLSPSELITPYPRVWYLPVFMVKNPNKPGKIRLVFDAAAKVNGISLNTMLLTGRDLLSPLLEILMRFRIHAYAFTGDIREMFHMVQVCYEDQMAQRILWRDCQQTKEPNVYVVTVMTFGATCSPYQAQYVMRLNASKYTSKFPDTVKSITKNTYVDDVLDGCETESDLLRLASEMQFIHSQGGFEIRNFKSNSPKLRKYFNQKESDANCHNLCESEGIEKVLGTFWSIHDDCITFSLRLNKAHRDVLNGFRKPTKREILVTLMSIYDPLGLIAHFVAGLKMIQQETWRLKLGWDEQIPDDVDKKWRKWLSQFKSIESLKIPRRYVSVLWSECTHTSLHVFVDAGEAAYAAVVYLRVVTSQNVQVSLVTAKVKAAPLKYIPIPRLELQAATIGARLLNTVKSALGIKVHTIYFWSDSSVVLSWLHSRKKLPSWVAYRVGEIRENTSINQWRWLPSNENVADIPTKWRDNIELDVNSRWYKGPDFLMEDEQLWPKQKFQHDTNVESTETESTSLECLTLHIKEVNDVIDATRFSNWNRLLRTAAYFFRFLNNITISVSSKYKGNLKSEELQKAENFLFREAQKTYSEEILLLAKGQKVPKQSPLYKLSPVLDETNIIRLKGRIEHEYPIILPRLHRITKLIVAKKHDECAHQFSETVVNELRKRFYIPRLRVLVRQVRRECYKCKILLARPSPPEMSPLPVGRIAVDIAPFSHTGIDLFGPFIVTVHRKHEKRWVVIFTCLTIRAIHLEMVSEMSTDSFLLAFRNFVARRGQPLECYSDRGTNLVGAEKIIKEAYKEVDFETIEEATTTSTLKWHFNPPLSPHMGGAWERLIRSIKSAMRVMLEPLRKPTPEVLQNILIEIENLINSRPLTYIPLDHQNQEAITPNHALLAYKNPSKSLGIPNNAIAPKLQWQQSQQALQRFYYNWTLTYRPTLTRRSKWFNSPGELKIDDLVLIVDENDKTRSFPRGRIVEVMRSRDGIVRTAAVQTSCGIYVRPVVKLAKLDVDAEGVVDPTQAGV